MNEEMNTENVQLLFNRVENDLLFVGEKEHLLVLHQNLTSVGDVSIHEGLLFIPYLAHRQVMVTGMEKLMMNDGAVLNVSVIRCNTRRKGLYKY